MAKEKALNDYEALRAKMIEQQKEEKAQLKKEWQDRRADRDAAIQSYLSGQKRRGQAKAEFDRVSPLPHEQSSGGSQGGYDSKLTDELLRDYQNRDQSHNQNKDLGKDDDFER